MNKLNEQLYKKALKTRYLYRTGNLSLKETTTELKEYIESYNKIVKELSKKYGIKSSSKFNVIGFLR